MPPRSVAIRRPRPGAMLRRCVPAVLAAGLVVSSACRSPREAPPIDDLTWQRELEAQFSGLDQLRTGPGGPLTWVGLWPLAEGETPVGSGTGPGIRVSAPGVPANAGLFRKVGTDVLLETAPGTTWHLADGTPVTGTLKLDSDASSRPTVLAFGALKLKVHEEPGSAQRWIRGWQDDAPAVGAYRSPARFPLNKALRVAAKLTPSASGQPIALEDVTGGTQAFALAGELSFTVADASQRLLAFKRPGRDSLFVVFRDSTSGRESYGAARYVYVPAPDKDRWTVLDFNKAHNPPCAFTTHSTCVLPPKQNRLAVPIRAGEQTPAGKRVGET